MPWKSKKRGGILWICSFVIIGMRKIENKLDELVYEEYGEELDAKDKEIEDHKKIIKTKDEEIKSYKNLIKGFVR